MMRPGSLFPKGSETRAALRRAGILTAAGAVGLVPALILVVTGILGVRRPDVVVHPVLVMGGLAAALGSSFVAVTHWEVSYEPGAFRVTCLIRKRTADLAILAAGAVLLAIVVGYLFMENFQPR
jgi:hypothetical protein